VYLQLILAHHYDRLLTIHFSLFIFLLQRTKILFLFGTRPLVLFRIVVGWRFKYLVNQS